jgi:hypothetical protein
MLLTFFNLPGETRNAIYRQSLESRCCKLIPLGNSQTILATKNKWLNTKGRNSTFSAIFPIRAHPLSREQNSPQRSHPLLLQPERTRFHLWDKHPGIGDFKERETERLEWSFKNLTDDKNVGIMSPASEI